MTAVPFPTRFPSVADAAVRFRWLRADAGRGVACAGFVALIVCGADDRIAAGTDSSLTGVGLRARVAVITRCAVGLRWIRTGTGRGVARAGVVALIGRGTDDWIGSRTRAVLTGVGLR